MGSNNFGDVQYSSFRNQCVLFPNHTGSFSNFDKFMQEMLGDQNMSKLYKYQQNNCIFIEEALKLEELWNKFL